MTEYVLHSHSYYYHKGKHPMGWDLGAICGATHLGHLITNSAYIVMVWVDDRITAHIH